MNGNTVSVDGGKFKLIVTNISKTDNSIKFTPYIKVTDAMNKAHTATITWKDEKGKKKEITKKNVKSKGNYFSTSKKYSNGDESVTITAEIAGKKSTVTVASTQKPKQPSISVQYEGDYHFTITVKGTGKKTIPTTSVILERQTDEINGQWTELKTWSGTVYGTYEHTFNDQTTERGHRYKYRIRAHNSNGYTDWQVKGFYYTLPPDVSDVAHVRNSNTKNTISWSKKGQEIDRNLITKYEIWRSDSGSAFKVVDYKLPGAAQDATLTYEDKTTGPDNYYSYIIKPRNDRGLSKLSYPSDEGTEPTYNTPGAPLSIKAVMTENGTVMLYLDNKEKTADFLEIEKYQDGTWTLIADDIDESTGPVTEYEDTTSTTGTVVKYRARNGRSDLPSLDEYSRWTVSNELSMLSVPNPPTLLEPVPNAAVAMDGDDVRLSWVHNPTDGTAQTRAQVVVYRNGTAYTTLQVYSSNFAVLTIGNNLAANDVITWKVRTKGAHSDYSDYSETRDFTLYAIPEIHITSPENGDTIENLPLEIDYDYSDDSGTLESLKLEILDDEGEIAFTDDIDVGAGTSGSYTYTLSDFLFDNESSYTLRLKALSSTGLQAVDDIGIYIEYVPVELSNKYVVDAFPDEDTGYVDLHITSAVNVPDTDPDPDVPQPIIVNSPVERALLYRVYDGKRTFIQEVTEDEQLTDRFAPLNTPFEYELLEVAENGNISIVSEICEIDSDYWYLYYGTDYNKTAKALWDPSGDVSLSRPEKEQIRYSGREYPVTYDSKANEEKYSFSFTITERDELNHFREMMKNGGQGIWKSADGFVYAADCEFSFSADYSDYEITWKAKLEVTRIESEAL